MRSASIRRRLERQKKYANGVYVREGKRERSCRDKGRDRLRENDSHGQRKGKEPVRKTTPERLFTEPTAPSQPSPSSSSLCALPWLPDRAPNAAS